MFDPRGKSKPPAADADEQIPTLQLSGGPPVISALEEELDLVDGELRYEKRQVLGSGGAGDVLLCHDRRIQRDVAMKLVGRGRGSTGSHRARFIREGRLQGQLEHPAVVPVYDLGIDANGEEFFTMKRVAGRTLYEVLLALRTGNQSDLREHGTSKLLAVFRQVLLGVEYAHSRGVLHCDLKPANIMLGDFGEVYVLDWGLARVRSEGGEHVLRDASGQRVVLGTPGYMAPELVKGAAPSEQSDVYALGAILFELLTHRPLHAGVSAEQLLESTLNGAVVDVSASKPDIAPELEAACVLSTMTDPRARVGSVHELRAAVDRFLEGDRDVELRAKLAREHERAADAAAQRAQGDDPAGREHRVALQEAGRALVLNPSSPRAAATLMRLLLAPPRETPPEVEAELMEAERLEGNVAARNGAVAYSVIAVLLALTAITARSVAALVFMVLPFVAAAGACTAIALRRTHSRWGAHVVLGLSSLGIAGLSGVFGPLVLVPGAAAVNTLALNLGAARRARWIFLVVGVACVLLPLSLEWAGVVSPSYAMEGGNMTLFSRVAAFREVPIGLVIGAISVIIIPTLIAWRVGNQTQALRERIHLQAWQLKRLIPSEVGSTPSMPPPPPGP